MFNSLQKYWPLICALLLPALAATLFFSPDLSQSLTLITLFISIIIALFLVIRQHWLTYRQGHITRRVFIFKATADILGLLFSVSAAIKCVDWVGEILMVQLEKLAIHGWVYFLASMLAVFLIGFAVANLTQQTWRRVITAAIKVI